MTPANDNRELQACELNVVDQYNEDFAALYRSVWDVYLADRQEAVLSQLFPDAPPPQPVLDAAAGTGALAIRLAKRAWQVTANEFSPAMRCHVYRQKLANDLSDRQFNVVEPGVSWRALPKALKNHTFGLVLCIGAALAHCDNSPRGVLRESLVALASLVAPGGFLLVDCKRYADDGRELLGDGRKRPLELADSEIVEWTDARDKLRKGSLWSSFSLSEDRSLTRLFSYSDADPQAGYLQQWTFRTWPVAKREVSNILSAEGMQVVQHIVVGGTGDKLPVDNLLFRKESQR